MIALLDILFCLHSQSNGYTSLSLSSISLLELNFDAGTSQARIDTLLKDSITITHVGDDSSSPIDWMIYYPSLPTPRYQIEFTPSSGTLKKKKSVTIQINLVCFMTTKLNLGFGFCIRKSNSTNHNSPLIGQNDSNNNNNSQYVLLSVQLESELSTKIDLGDIQLMGKPIGNGGYGVGM